MLGAVASATERLPLMTYVTCPTMRYHPTVVAQKAATVALLAGGGRFVLGLGAGENLNEHVVGRGWPPANVRHEMLSEAVEIIGELFAGGYVNVERTALPRRLGEAVGPARGGRADRGGGVRVRSRSSGSRRWSTPWWPPSPLAELVAGFDAAAGADLPKIGQQPISWGPDRDAAVARAHEQFRWFAGGWKVNAELPGTAAFAAASQFVTPDDVAAAFSCGPDVAAHVEAVRPFVDAGFTHVALVQVGGDDPARLRRLRRAGAAARTARGVRQDRGGADPGALTAAPTDT